MNIENFRWGNEHDLIWIGSNNTLNTFIFKIDDKVNAWFDMWDDVMSIINEI